MTAEVTAQRHRRLARLLANALDSAAGPHWNADNGVDVRLQDAPLQHRRPDVTVYRADTIDVTPTRPEHVLLIVEIDPDDEPEHYAAAGIPFYWRITHTTSAPLARTYVRDPATGRYNGSETFTGVMRPTIPFRIEVDLSQPVMTEMTPQRAQSMNDDEVLALTDAELREYARAGGDLGVVFEHRGFVPDQPGSSRKPDKLR